MSESAQVDWRARALEAERRAAEAWDAYHRLAADQHDAIFFKRALESQSNSLSWRVTSPLRLAKRIVVVVSRLARQFLASR